jgi:hypothetical protein
MPAAIQSACGQHFVLKARLSMWSSSLGRLGFRPDHGLLFHNPVREGLPTTHELNGRFGRKSQTESASASESLLLVAGERLFL